MYVQEFWLASLVADFIKRGTYKQLRMGGVWGMTGWSSLDSKVGGVEVDCM